MFTELSADDLAPAIEDVFDHMAKMDLEWLNTHLVKMRDAITQINMHIVAVTLRASSSQKKALADWDSLLVTAVQESIKNGYPGSDMFYGLWTGDHPLYKDLYAGVKRTKADQLRSDGDAMDNYQWM
jgi:hypothetical protein